MTRVQPRLFANNSPISTASISRPRPKSPLKWHGGKSYLAGWIVDQFCPHLHYVEPYFGGGSVLLARDPNRNWSGSGKLESHHKGCSEVVNDINGELMNFYRVLRDDPTDLVKALSLTPFSQSEFELAMQGPQPGESDVERARKFFVRYRQSRQGLGKDWATLSKTRTRRGMQEAVSSSLSAIEGLPECHERFQSVAIACGDAIDLIKTEDRPSTLFYCDPPYLHQTRVSTDAYEHEMNEADHRRLLGVLGGVDGKFVLSGYRSPLYDSFADQHGWRCEEKQIDNKASSAKKKAQKTECLWMNY